MEVVGYLALLEGAELQNKRQQAGLTLRPPRSHTLPHRCMPGAWTDAHPCVSLRSHFSRRSPTIFSAAMENRCSSFILSRFSGCILKLILRTMLTTSSGTVVGGVGFLGNRLS